jgi:Response regulator containing CheY-like receiver, AAA-type ATPase, and DNA-binding domains
MRNRILVIDDNPPNLELMMYLLRANGMDVTGADTGAAGLAIAFKGDFDLFVCDIQLPDIGRSRGSKAVARPLRIHSDRGGDGFRHDG